MQHKSPRPNLVVFCGAGLSAHLGIPTMDRFADDLRYSGFLSPEEQADFDRIQMTCNSLAAMIGASARNLEQLASFLSILQLSRPDFRFRECCNDLQTPSGIISKILQCMAFMVKPDLNGGATGLLSSILSLSREANVSFITTNYDMHIELGALLAGMAVTPAHSNVKIASDPCEGERVPLYDQTGTSNIRIYKLHGSVNWLRTSSGDIQAVCNVIATTRSESQARTPNNFHLEGYAFGQDRGAIANACRAQQRLIVPPTVLKPSFFEDKDARVLRDQWRGASQVLSDADRVWFVGYSFPETDSFMRYFLGASLFNNARLRQLAVIDPDHEVIESRARPLFASPHHQEIFQGYPARWQDIQMHHLFQGNMHDVVPVPIVKQIRDRQEAQVILTGNIPAIPQAEIPAGSRMRARGRGRGRGF